MPHRRLSERCLHPASPHTLCSLLCPQTPVSTRSTAFFPRSGAPCLPACRAGNALPWGASTRPAGFPASSGQSFPSLADSSPGSRSPGSGPLQFFPASATPHARARPLPARRSDRAPAPPPESCLKRFQTPCARGTGPGTVKPAGHAGGRFSAFTSSEATECGPKGRLLPAAKGRICMVSRKVASDMPPQDHAM